MFLPNVFKTAKKCLLSRDCQRITVVALLILLCAGATWYSRYILHGEGVFSHLCYVPIALAGFWWGRRGVWVGVLLGALLIASHFLPVLGPLPWEDVLRSMMFIAVGLTVGLLRERALRSETNLRETRDYLDSLIRHANAPIIVWDREGRITRFNHAFERLAGYAASEVIGRELLVLFPEASRDESLQKIARTLDGEYWESVEIPILRKDGETRLALWNSANIYAPDGKTLVATIAQGTDITARKQVEEALRESEVKHRLLLSSIQSPVLALNEDMTILYCNDAYAEFVGKPLTELEGESLLALFPYSAYLKVLETGKAHEAEGSLGDRYLHARVYRTPWGILSIAEDITERRQAEEALRRRLEELTALHAVAIAGAKATSLDALIERATEVIGNILHPDNFGVGLLDETAGTLRIHPSYRGSQDPQDCVIPLGQGVTGRVAATGQLERISDVTREPAYRDVDPDIRSELCVPLKVGQRVIGVINAESSRRDAFSEADERLMMTFAGQLATAIEKVRLFEAERRRAQEAETLRQAGAAVAATLQQDEAIERILQELARVVPHDSASVQLLREGYLEIVGGRGWSDLAAVVGLRFPVPGDNPNTTVIQQRRPHILTDAPAAYAIFCEEPHTRIRSWLGVPLIVHDQVIGMLAVDSAQPNHFTPDHARLVAAFADQVAIAIENARLFKEVQQLAITDSLTGLFNRRHFFELAKREFDSARRYQRPLSALMLDADHFKRVNDTYGHATGDEVLRVIAGRCQDNLRQTDVLGRYGGDELAFLLPETDLVNAQMVAEKLRQQIAQSAIDTGRAAVTITASLGIGLLDEGCADLDALLQRADQALYAAKGAGRNCVRVWQS